MATQLQLRSGTTLQNDMFTGAPGELTYDTEKHNIRIHDGVTVGGMQIADSGTADFVIEWQRPTEENGYTWYRKYKSGWVEQGGEFTNVDSATVSLAIEMADANYSVAGAMTSNTSGNGWRVSSRTTTSFVVGRVSTTNVSAFWQVSGMAA